MIFEVHYLTISTSFPHYGFLCVPQSSLLTRNTGRSESDAANVCVAISERIRLSLVRRSVVVAACGQQSSCTFAAANGGHTTKNSFGRWRRKQTRTRTQSEAAVMRELTSARPLLHFFSASAAFVVRLSRERPEKLTLRCLVLPIALLPGER